LVDILGHQNIPARVHIQGNKISKIERLQQPSDSFYILPGLVDSHVHIESSMLSPEQFARLAVIHGTVGTVSDPHEIANVLGRKGIEFMVESGNRVPMKFNFGVPSCVPSTPFETSGAVLDSGVVEEMLQDSRFKYLSEMMNFPGVLQEDEEVMLKIGAAQQNHKPIDGHAPGLRGNDLKKYVGAGISTEHECSTYEEALEKIRAGMTIQIREGSAARNFDALYPLIDQYPNQVMLCSDDRHPDDLMAGHINALLKKGLKYGLNFYHLLKAATINPVRHYGLDIGLLQEGDPADFILIDHPDTFNLESVFINGDLVFDGRDVLFEPESGEAPNVMNARKTTAADFKVPAQSSKVRVIHAQDHELYTTSSVESLPEKEGYLTGDPGRDILKVAVINRYQRQSPAVGFIKNFGFKHGALGTSIAHDSHNLMVVGTDDETISQLINQLIDQNGGLVATDGNTWQRLPLEIAGLMTHQTGQQVIDRYKKLSDLTRKMGCSLASPFMTLSFMALPVIPEMKITDKGLFDVGRFKPISLYA